MTWKAMLSPDYRDGQVFVVTTLTDDRFADVVSLVGGLSDAQLQQHRDYLTALPEGAELLMRAPVARLAGCRSPANLSNCTTGHRWLRTLYVAMFALMLFHAEVPSPALVLKVID